MEKDVISKVWPEWHIKKQLGRGSFGVVYEVVRTDQGIESRAAVKVVSIPQDESELDTLRSEGVSEDMTRTYVRNMVDDFVQEIQIMQEFKGTQNIVSVEDYQVIECPDRVGWDIYIRMELLTPINSYYSDRILQEAEIIRLGVDLCTALELCAGKHIIHRDIKPENIFVNQFGNFKLGDFGIARSMENLTSSLSYKGTYNYMAPEVAQGNSYDATADIYSLGLVLYRLSNKNRFPFLNTEKQLLSPNERAEATKRRIAGEALPAPCNASKELAEVILCACAPDPANRFRTPTAMKKALQQIKTEASPAKSIAAVPADGSGQVLSATEVHALKDKNQRINASEPLIESTCSASMRGGYYAA